MKGTYITLSFKTKKQAEKNEKDIKQYFSSILSTSDIIKGTDERGNYGYMVEFTLA